MRNWALGLLLLWSAGCGGAIRHAAAGTTAEILAMAQPALQQENDYELAARAVPGALKTIEGFYVALALPDSAASSRTALSSRFFKLSRSISIIDRSFSRSSIRRAVSWLNFCVR
jgi:hypothetical protein